MKMKGREENKKKGRKKLEIALCLVFAIVIMTFIIPIVQAIGITPGRTTIYFEPGLKKEVEFKILNNEHKDMKVAFYVEGNLSEIIKLKEKETHLKQIDNEKTFSYSFKLPQKIETPGTHEARIVAMEIPPKEGEEGTYVKATVAVATQLVVIVPYPGKYLETKLAIIEGVNESKFIFLAHNLGEENIQDAYVRIEIIDKDNNLIETLETEHSSINSKKRGEFNVEWEYDKLGSYFARATIFYDGQTKKEEKWFKIGGMGLELVSITVKDFTLGEVAKFTILVENKLNEPIEDVLARLIITEDLKSATTAIPPLSYGTLNIYWDTEGINEGDYDGKFILQAGKDSLERPLKIKVKPDRIDVEIIGVTAAVIGEEEKGKLNSLLIILIIILILANIAWFTYFKNKTKFRKRRE